MNLLILHGSSDLYGASKILLVTVQLLLKKGYKPLVVLGHHGPLADKLLEAGAEVTYVRLGILRRKYKTPAGILNRLFVLLKAYRSLRRLISERQIDIVYSNTTAVLAGALAARSKGVKHVWHIHEIIESPKWLSRLLGMLVNRFSHTVIVVSAAVQANWGRFVKADKLQLIHNGIDYSPHLQASGKLRNELGLSEDIVVVGMIGRVHYWKGQAYFLEIASRLHKQFPHLHFVMIGDAFPGYEYLYDQLAAIVAKENLHENLTNLGYRTDIAELLQGFDILVLPSILPDPFPTVILEAMASGKPVVATQQGGALEMVDNGLTGIWIPVMDATHAAAAMQELVTDPSLRKLMGDKGRQKVLAQYSLEAFENKMIKVFE
jgi:glycosyltransferase involved in cell wall biosynthesis